MQYLEQSGIFPQYTIPGTPSMNDIAKRQNRTLQDMVRSMMAESLLHISLWGEAFDEARPRGRQLHTTPCRK